MRQILEDAMIGYRQEAANLLMLVAPVLIAGPFIVLFAATGLVASLAAVPLLLLLYLVAYAACVRATGLIMRNLSPEPSVAYLDVLASSPALLRVAAPGGVLLAAVTASGLIISDLGVPWLGLQVGLLGSVAFLVWWARHAYDQPLILAHEVEVAEAGRIGDQLAQGGLAWTATLLAVVSLPLFVAGLMSWLLALTVAPVFGGAVFTLALALWLPFAALSLTRASTELMGAPQA